MTKVAPSKDELERQKLALEIRELQRKWWQRPVYLSILLPVVLASLTILAGVLSGYFNRERIELQRDVKALKAEKTTLIRQTALLEEERTLTRLKEFRSLPPVVRKLLAEIGVEGPVTPTPFPSPTHSPN